jgi:hypothetical protein
MRYVSLDRNPFERYMADGELVDASGKPVMENGAPVVVKKMTLICRMATNMTARLNLKKSTLNILPEIMPVRYTR